MMCDAQRPAGTGDLSWFKSTRSGGSGKGACVQVAWDSDGVVMRDSKDPAGTVLLIAPPCWQSFVAKVRDGVYDRR